jgi:multiple sugar transport system substrate-binding protein
MKRWLYSALLGAMISLLAACGGDASAPATLPATPTSPPAATATPQPIPSTAAAPETNVIVDFWTSDNEPKRVAVYQTLAIQYEAAHSGVQVNIVPIVESTVLEQLEAAQAAGELPDLLRIGIESVSALDGAGLLDPAAAQAVIGAIGAEDFREGVLAMVTDAASGERLAVPYDGWIQALWYRRDRFETLGLNRPISWAEINQACDVIDAGGDPAFALVLPTADNQNYIHQVFELALRRRRQCHDEHAGDGRGAALLHRAAAMFAPRPAGSLRRTRAVRAGRGSDALLQHLHHGRLA